MSEQDEKASYIDILEEQLARAEEEIGLLKMEAEHDGIQRDHELANFMDYAGKQNKLITDLLEVVKSYVDHFDKHSHNYMSEELNKITRDAKGVLGR